jgi:hypothetical protein
MLLLDGEFFGPFQVGRLHAWADMGKLGFLGRVRFHFHGNSMVMMFYFVGKID